jgi:two-component system NtrC family sensor kinase
MEAMERSPISEAGASRSSVLVVDDIEANLVAMDALLDDLGCDVVRASSGNKALALLLKREFAVMLLDVHMPQMDGFEVARHVRMNPITREVPIIFLTAAHSSEDHVLRGYGSGAVDFLQKPVDATILRSKVRVFLDLYSSRRQIAAAKNELEHKNLALAELAEANAALARKYRDAHDGLERAYQELQTTQAQLVQSAKMASLGELVAGVAHEINNPLAFSLSHLETALRSVGELEGELAADASAPARQSWQRAQSRLSEMKVGLERIRHLVIKLRTFSRLDEGECKTVSVKESVDSLLTILGHKLRNRVEVETDLREPDSIDCYPSLLNQALMNLLSNAIDAIEGSGKIRISSYRDGANHVLSVRDSGQGIPKELRERIFEPFFTTKPVGQGTGLGLPIAYSIVKKHGGVLELNDAEGGGTEAVIRIPSDQHGGRAT